MCVVVSIAIITEINAEIRHQLHQCLSANAWIFIRYKEKSTLNIEIIHNVFQTKVVFKFGKVNSKTFEMNIKK